MTHDFPYIVKLDEGQMEEFLRAYSYKKPITLRLVKYTNGKIELKLELSMLVFIIIMKDANIDALTDYICSFKDYHYIYYTPHTSIVGVCGADEDGWSLLNDESRKGSNEDILILYKHKAELNRKDGKFIFL